MSHDLNYASCQEAFAARAAAPTAWMSDYDTASTVDKSLFSDPSIGNCPGCSNVRWHAKQCPWLAGYRAAPPDALSVRIEALAAEWALTEFPHEGTALMMRHDLAALLKESQ